METKWHKYRDGQSAVCPSSYMRTIVTKHSQELRMICLGVTAYNVAWQAHMLHQLTWTHREPEHNPTDAEPARKQPVDMRSYEHLHEHICMSHDQPQAPIGQPVLPGNQH